MTDDTEEPTEGAIPSRAGECEDAESKDLAIQAGVHALQETCATSGSLPFLPHLRSHIESTKAPM